MKSFESDPQCHVCANCGVSRPRNVLSLHEGKILCLRTDHCLLLLATTPVPTNFSTQHQLEATK